MSHGWHLSGAVCRVRTCGCVGRIMGVSHAGTCLGPCVCRVRRCGCVGRVMGVSHGWHLSGAVCVPCEVVRVCRPCGLRAIGCMSDTYRALRLCRLCFDAVVHVASTVCACPVLSEVA